MTAARSSPASARNREPILQVLKARLPPKGLVLEIASGAGEHAAWFAAALPHLDWQPTDPDETALASIAAWRDQAGCPNLKPPLRLDAAAAAGDWPVDQAEAMVCVNMIHIAPWAAAQGLMAGAARVLGQGGVLYLYGPYREGGRHTADSNAAFDESLKSRNAEWGIRDLEAVVALAGAAGLALTARIQMPANNLSLVFVRG